MVKKFGGKKKSRNFASFLKALQENLSCILSLSEKLLLFLEEACWIRKRLVEYKASAVCVRPNEIGRAHV